MSSPLDAVRNAGISIGQVGLIVGGIFFTFIAERVFPLGKGTGPAFVHLLGVAMLAGGGAWWLADKSHAVASSYGNALTFDPVIKGGSYANPVNNLHAVKPRNRFDKQINYIMNPYNASFDTFINDTIMQESKSMGMDMLDKNNYPEAIAPWLIPSLNPTTPTAPSRDFNTVKMIA